MDEASHLHAFPVLVPVPEADGHVVRARQNIGESRVDGNTANVVAVGIPGVNLFVGVVVEDAELHIVGSCNHVVLAGNELGSTDY